MKPHLVRQCSFLYLLSPILRLMLTAAVLLCPLGSLAVPVQPALASGPEPLPLLTAPAASAGTMLQFKSGGHILGFQPDKVYLAGLDHALSVEFVGAARVMPQANAPHSREERVKDESFSGVTYSGLWPGIDVSYAAQPGGIAKSTYVVAPGADPARIRLRTNAPAELQADGSLRFAFASGSLTEAAPVAWQEIDGRRIPVPVAFQIGGRRSPVGGQLEIGFALGAYNPAYPLTIDPGYAWHTFYGSSSTDAGFDIALDASGNVYITGVSYATWDGPGGTAPLHAFSGNSNIVVIKLDNSGTYQWHTFYGGHDRGDGIALDASGNIYVTGDGSTTWDGPGTCTTPGTSPCPLNAYRGDSDIVVVKLDGSGTYQWHTFYGGSGRDDGIDIALDASDNVYVTGGSAVSWDGPGTCTTPGISPCPLNAHGGERDIVVVKMDSSGDYLWHTFYGGSSISYGGNIVVDANENIYVAGYNFLETWNGPGGVAPLHAFSGDVDAVVLKLNSSGSYQWHTFYYTGYEGDICIGLDAGGNIYVASFSSSTWDGPGTPPVAPLHAYSGGVDIAVIKLDSNGAYQWHTFYGSSDADQSRGIAVDADGDIYVTGESCATWDGPGGIAPLDAFSGTGRPAHIVVVKLDSSGTYQWHTFYGGSTGLYEDGHYGQGIAVDAGGSVYVTGVDRAVWNGPGDVAPLHPYSGNYDIVVVRTDPRPILDLSKSVTPALAAPGDAITYTLAFSNTSAVTATQIVLTDSVPGSVTVIGVISSGVAITQVGGTRYVWNVSDLALGQGGVITISGVLSKPLAAAGAAPQSADAGVAVSSGQTYLYLPIIMR
jgi:uncharacterized repeat protein (TIGR01451 family)